MIVFWKGDSYLRYFQHKLFTITHGMNSVFDLYSTERKGCRKNDYMPIFMVYLKTCLYYCLWLLISSSFVLTFVNYQTIVIAKLRYLY